MVKCIVLLIGRDEKDSVSHLCVWIFFFNPDCALCEISLPDDKCTLSKCQAIITIII